MELALDVFVMRYIPFFVTLFFLKTLIGCFALTVLFFPGSFFAYFDFVQVGLKHRIRKNGFIYCDRSTRTTTIQRASPAKNTVKGKAASF